MEYARHNVQTAQLILADHGGDRLCSCQLHLLINSGSPAVERSSENARKAEDIVNLIRIIGSARCEYSDDVLYKLRTDFRLRISHCEYNRLRSHCFDMRTCQYPARGDTDEYIRADERLGQSAAYPKRIRMLRVPLPIRVILAAVGCQDTLAIYADNVLCPAGEQHFSTGRSCSADPAHDDPRFTQTASGQLECV
ncbi:hypothetical protein D3C80_1311650 [compost metagenome]